MKFLPLLNRYFSLSLLLFYSLSPSGYAQSISEKKTALVQKKGGQDLEGSLQSLLSSTNRRVQESQEELRELYEEVEQLYSRGADPSEYRELLERMEQLRRTVSDLEKDWRDHSSEKNREEQYALWHQPETTLEELIIDYGAQDYAYLIAPEIAQMKVSINSSVPIPRVSWPKVLEGILRENGVGIKEINPYLRKLIPLKNDFSSIQTIIDQKEELSLYPKESRICYLFNPGVADVSRLFSFLQKFIDPEQSTLIQDGGEIYLFATVGKVEELFKLYEFSLNHRGAKDYRLIRLRTIKAKEMVKILDTVFASGSSSSNNPFPIRPSKLLKNESRFQRNVGSSSSSSSGFKAVLLDDLEQTLFLIGSEQELDKAQQLIDEMDGQFNEFEETTVFWYQTKHTEATELAEVLSKVYGLLIGDEGERDPKEEKSATSSQEKQPPKKLPDDGTLDLIVKPSIADPSVVTKEEKVKEFKNFVVDPKTGSIVMVVRSSLLPRIKELLARLDVPKKMVSIEVLLVEKSLNDTSNFGLNLLRMGSGASQTNTTDLSWNDGAANRGILDFMVSRLKSGSVPAYDLTYRFLISQEDIQVNSNPSVTTVNQTPATIAIVTEKSINTGFFEADMAGSRNTKDAVKGFKRQQYGITIKITPTIHPQNEFGESDKVDYITLESDITFDTTGGQVLDQPEVVRRHITNHVKIPDGETVILGGLRSKNMTDSKNALPFLGEIPGVGKFFSSTELTESSKEMYIFITPRIVPGEHEDLDRMRMEEFCKRPGDIPEFMHCLKVAQEEEKRLFVEGTVKALFGWKKDWESRGEPLAEYEGR